MPEQTESRLGDIRRQLAELIHHLEHVLPGQAPIRDFVHHNTLHGFQHLDFTEALAEARRTTGNYGYLPVEQFRTYYRQGRITAEDLTAALFDDAAVAVDEHLVDTSEGPLLLRDLYLAALLHPLKPVTGCQLSWQFEELDALRRVQPDVDERSKGRLLRAAKDYGLDQEAAILDDLWNACLEVLGLQHYLLHPEELLDLSPALAERMLARIDSEEEGGSDQPLTQRRMRQEAVGQLHALLDRVGRDLTLRGLLQALTGHDILEDLQPSLVRHMAAYLDQGIAPLHHKNREDGFYAAWRSSADVDLIQIFEDLDDWRHHLQSLPLDPLDTVIEELKRLGLPRERWTGYLKLLALELPGWSGMFLWRHLRPGYEDQTQPINMLDYLAVRLVTERLFAQRLTTENWNIEASIEMLRWHLRRCPEEFKVRHSLFNRHLPEYLVSRSHNLVRRASNTTTAGDQEHWQYLAQLVWTWEQTAAADKPNGYSVYRNAWPLFRLAQHLGLASGDIRRLGAPGVARIFECLNHLDDERSGYIWLCAYERHYREQLFNAIVNNQGRGRWSQRKTRPQAQIVFCMDDREEGLRRHLEELNPAVETLGAAGFFGVAINWRGLDDHKVTPLCPVVVTPSHEVKEVIQPQATAAYERHRNRHRMRQRFFDILHQEIRRNLISSTLGIMVAAPAALAATVAKVWFPLFFGELTDKVDRAFDPALATEVAITTKDSGTEATPDNPQQGFTDQEQADRVYRFLRTIGLTAGFAPLVAMMGHGSTSQNNPHRAAYDCGACSGRHGGPNARVFAAMANRPEIRDLLAERGVIIPEDCWFLGAFHNTCDESIDWYDLDRVPESLRGALSQLQSDLTAATRGSAHERSRKFASAPRNPNPDAALKHIRGRNYDFSQARPELGHATNAAAIIGRRALSQGVFFDRRVFLISYDPTADPAGEVVESILLAAGPVGAGINLEYYFSTVNNDLYGCGSKVTHNITGSFGVMEGTSSDLRTGLPKQMIEIHEAMRLLVVVEAKTDVLTTIYQRQPALQELVGKRWLLLAAKDPDSAAIHRFLPDRGWVEWQGEISQLTTVGHSSDYYPGTMEPLPPVLIAQPGSQQHA